MGCLIDAPIDPELCFFKQPPNIHDNFLSISIVAYIAWVSGMWEYWELGYGCREWLEVSLKFTGNGTVIFLVLGRSPFTILAVLGYLYTDTFADFLFDWWRLRQFISGCALQYIIGYFMSCWHLCSLMGGRWWWDLHWGSRSHQSYYLHELFYHWRVFRLFFPPSLLMGHHYGNTKGVLAFRIFWWVVIHVCL